MRVGPIRRVADLAGPARFYPGLGLVQGDGSGSGNCTELTGSGGNDRELDT